MLKNAFLFEGTKDNAEYLGCVVSLGFSLPARAAEGSGWTYQDLKVQFSVGPEHSEGSALG